MSDKKFTPKEAAIAVLAKAQELYRASTLAKSEQPLEKKYEGFKAVEASAAKSGASDPAAVAAAVGMKKYGKKRFEEAAHAGKKMHKADEAANPDEKEDAKLGEEVEKAVEQHEMQNEAPEHEMKGHIKLAKFMGRMEHKKGQKAKEMDKGEHQPHPGATSAVPAYQAAGQAKEEAHLNTPQGNAERMQGNAQRMQAAPAKGAHEQTLDQIHQMSKPKLGKGM